MACAKLFAQAVARAARLLADDSRIFVLRQLPAFRRIRFTYDALVHNEAGAATFVLLGGDVVVVE